MIRMLIIGAIIAVAFTLYALVDAAMSDSARARGVSKPVWVVLIVVLPVIGAALWFFIGKGRGPVPAVAKAPDDDPRFSGVRMSGKELDAHLEELEQRLRELDDELFPGEGKDNTVVENGAEAADGVAESSADDPADGSADGGEDRPTNGRDQL